MDRFDDGKYFIINPDTRKVTIPVKYSSVIGDNGSQIFTFSIKRYIDGYDIMDCNDVTIHYDIISEENGSKLYSDVYQCDDLRVSETDENIVLVSWKLSKNATKFNGILSFTIKYSTTYVDEEEQVKETYVLQSRICEKLRIFTRVNNSQQIVEEYGDVLQQWKEDLERSKPTANVSKEGKEVTITITDKNGTTSSVVFDGASAYEIAVENGFEGSEEEWLESLKYTSSEEFQQLAEQVKQDAQTSSNKAQEATTAATNADKYAKDAQASKEEANESALSAAEASNSAGISASSAADSANTAKTNADKTNQDKTEVSNLVSGFDDRVDEKTTEFNQNATEKTNAFDTKVVEANSTIDGKVTEATEQADKAKSEADRATQVTDEKLDKNQGAENVGKVMVVNEEGNLVPGESLPKNIYTKEEVDYLLDDKMDKPYYDITVSDNTTIENTLGGNFKIKSIDGNIYQAEESNIVPIPERPIRIHSKKIKVGEEYVELRSLKESKNLFDKNLLVANAGNNQKDSPAIQLKDKETYTISCSKNGVESILGIRATKKSDGSDTEIKLLRTTVEQGSFVVDYTTYENYIVRVYSTAFDIVDTIQLEKGSSATSYVPATVRDYKIVDHTTKTSKIVRNVGYKLLTRSDSFYKSAYGGMETTIKDAKKQSAEANTKSYCNLFNASVKAGLPENLHFRLGDVYLLFNYEGYNDNDKWNEFLDSNELYLVYELATSTEESIPYVETDTNEIGLSWQDSTSPSPDIPSEIYKVEELNIKIVGKNLLNPNSNNTIQGVYKSFIVNPLEKQITFSITDRDTNVDISSIYFGSMSNGINIGGEGSGWLVENGAIKKRNMTNNLKYFTFHPTNDETITKIFQRFYIQVEYGSEVTDYEPYQEISIKHTLLKPLRATKDGSVRDIIDIVNKQTTYNLSDIIYDGSDDENWKSYAQSGDIIRYYLELDNGIDYLVPQNINVQSNIFIQSDVDLGMERISYRRDAVSELLSVYINKNRLDSNDVSGFKKWLKENNLLVLYQMKEITEPLEDELVQKLKSLKTFSPVTHIFIEGVVKPILNAQYPKDIAAAQAQLEKKIVQLQEVVIKNV